MSPLDDLGRTCTKCGVYRSWDNFYADNTRRSGQVRKMSACKSCNATSSMSKQRAYKKQFGKMVGRTQPLSQHRPPEGTPCENCGTPMTHQRGATMMCFDHDPAGEYFRGWICQGCNTGLGKLGDSIESLERALQYLQRAKARNT